MFPHWLLNWPSGALPARQIRRQAPARRRFQEPHRSRAPRSRFMLDNRAPNAMFSQIRWRPVGGSLGGHVHVALPVPGHPPRPGRRHRDRGQLVGQRRPLPGRDDGRRRLRWRQSNAAGAGVELRPLARRRDGQLDVTQSGCSASRRRCPRAPTRSASTPTPGPSTRPATAVDPEPTGSRTTPTRTLIRAWR